MKEYFDRMLELYFKIADGTATCEEFHEFALKIITRDDPELYYYNIQKLYNEKRKKGG